MKLKTLTEAETRLKVGVHYNRHLIEAETSDQTIADEAQYFCEYLEDFHQAKAKTATVAKELEKWRSIKTAEKQRKEKDR